MNDKRIQVDLLIDTLGKKKQLLIEIKQYTENQRKILTKDKLDYKAFNNIMKNKQVRIELLNKIDDGFELTFERVKTVLTTQSDIYRDEIVMMKKLITEVSDIGIEIQVQEERNKINFETKSKDMNSEVKSFRNHKTAMKKYQSSYNSLQKADAPHFFDSKK